MTDLDQSGHGFQRVRTYLGPSLGWVDELVQPSVEVTTGGVHTVQPGESLLLVNVAAAVTIQLPDVIKWMQQSAYQPATGFDRSITVKDIGGNAANFNIVITPFGQQVIDNIQQSTVISTARAIVRFVPLINLTGWSLQANVGAGGGGGGGGDVFKAGNNTFTGSNTFQSAITAPTVVSSDDSENVATTGFVKAQGYLISASLAPYALLFNPVFTGDPKAPTPTLGDNDTSIATTAFVQAALAGFTGGATPTAQYILGAVNAGLPASRLLTDTASITWDLTTPGIVRANTSAGGGNVSNSGAPVAGQLAQWVTTTTIKGVDGSTLFAPIASPVFTGDPQAPTPATTDNDTTIATTAYVKANLANFQPLDGDLTALSGLSGTNTIYYRSATDIWSPVTYSGLAFSGGVLSVTAGGGNVNNVGTPSAGQIAVWTDPTHIQGVAPASVPQRTVLKTGSGTYNTPAGARWLEVELVGGGAGGTGGGGSTGGAGGTTTFGTLSANGGSGTSGGAASGGDVSLIGGGGEGGSFGSGDEAVAGTGGVGGASAFGGAGSSGYAFPGGNAAPNSGGGGGGGGSVGSGLYQTGAGGGSGGYVKHIFTTPAATYSYVIGVAGVGSSPGTGGYNGGNGGSGIIIVTAYF